MIWVWIIVGVVILLLIGVGFLYFVAWGMSVGLNNRYHDVDNFRYYQPFDELFAFPVLVGKLSESLFNGMGQIWQPTEIHPTDLPFQYSGVSNINGTTEEINTLSAVDLRENNFISSHLMSFGMSDISRKANDFRNFVLCKENHDVAIDFFYSVGVLTVSVLNKENVCYEKCFIIKNIRNVSLLEQEQMAEEIIRACEQSLKN